MFLKRVWLFFFFYKYYIYIVVDGLVINLQRKLFSYSYVIRRLQMMLGFFPSPITRPFLISFFPRYPDAMQTIIIWLTLVVFLLLERSALYEAGDCRVPSAKIFWEAWVKIIQIIKAWWCYFIAPHYNINILH